MVMCAGMLLPSASLAAVSDFVGSSEDSCELPSLPGKTKAPKTSQVTANLTMAMNHSAQEPVPEKSILSWLQSGTWIWWLGGGILTVILTVALTWQIRQK